jgi:hypothetical protein
MVSATIHRPESEKPSAKGKTFPLLRLLSSEPIDEISKGFVFSASLIGLFCELTSALWAYRPRPDSAPSDLLGFGVAVIAEVANHLVAAIDDDHIFLRHFSHLLSKSRAFHSDAGRTADRTHRLSRWIFSASENRILLKKQNLTQSSPGGQINPLL